MTLLRQIATLGFIGYLPLAPGTFGSLVACILFIIIKPSPVLHILIVLFIIPVGIASSHYAEILLKDSDSRHIVIDEFIGYFIAVLFVPFSYVYAVAAFLLFRFFDILKPFPIKNIERVFRGGKGIVADDIIAALYANVIIQVVRLFKYI